MLFLATQYGYLGLFIVSFVGSVVPFPFALILFISAGLKQSGTWIFEPLLIALVAGIACTLGEFISYLVGYAGSTMMKDRYEARIERVREALRKYFFSLIFLFAVLPLPDDILWIPLGVMKYDVKKIVLPAFLGKFLMCLIVAYGGRFSFEVIGNLFGGETSLFSLLAGIVVSVISLVVVLLIMFKIDWVKRMERHAHEHNGEKL